MGRCVWDRVDNAAEAEGGVGVVFNGADGGGGPGDWWLLCLGSCRCGCSISSVIESGDGVCRTSTSVR